MNDDVSSKFTLDTTPKPEATPEAPPPKFKLLFFREDCFDEFLKFNLFYKDCISITMSKGLGYGIIIGASVVKFPQLYNILKARSGRGILPSMFYTESIMHIIGGSYNVHLNSPFSVYGENFSLLFQNFWIIYLLWLYETEANKTSTQMKVFVTFFITFTLVFLLLDWGIPESFWKFLMNIQLFILTYSRLPQIMENFRNKSTGELSLLTFFLNCAGNLARLFTFVKEADDLLNMVTAGLSAVLNGTICVQIGIYWHSDKKYDEVGHKDDEQTPIEEAEREAEMEEKPHHRHKELNSY